MQLGGIAVILCGMVVVKTRGKKKEPIVWEKVDWRSYGPGLVVGLDEVGRGCLAGPVVASAVVLLSDELNGELTDSKLLSENQRESQSEKIRASHHFGIGFASVEEIDRINILQASLLAMKRALEEIETKLGTKASHLLIDGTFRIPGIAHKQTTFVKGDLRVAPISAASVVAKVHRDRWMKEIALSHPQYGFDGHKGYASPQHKKAIEQFGPCEWHRRSFSGVKEYCVDL